MLFVQPLDGIVRAYLYGNRLQQTSVGVHAAVLRVQGNILPSPLGYSIYGGGELHGLRPGANYTDRATTACRRSDCQLLRIEGATWSA
jgi:hypothetical protein